MSAVRQVEKIPNITWVVSIFPTQIDEKMNFEDLDAQLAALQAELKSDIKKVFIISEQ